MFRNLDIAGCQYQFSHYILSSLEFVTAISITQSPYPGKVSSEDRQVQYVYECRSLLNVSCLTCFMQPNRMRFLIRRDLGRYSVAYVWSLGPIETTIIRAIS